MQEFFIQLFHNFPPQAATVLLSMIPVTELRVSLPLALEVYHLPIAEAFFYSFIGNIIPVFFILKFFEWAHDFLCRRSAVMRKFFEWLFERTRKKFFHQYERFGAVALVIFVAIPLPMTGAWTGALAAYLFGIPATKAFLLVSLGVFFAAVIVSAVTLGVANIF